MDRKVLQVPKSQYLMDPDESWVLKQTFFLPSCVIPISMALPFWFPHQMGSFPRGLGRPPNPRLAVSLLVGWWSHSPYCPPLPWLVCCDLSLPAWPHPTHWNSILGYQFLLNPSAPYCSISTMSLGLSIQRQACSKVNFSGLQSSRFFLFLKPTWTWSTYSP